MRFPIVFDLLDQKARKFTRPPPTVDPPTSAPSKGSLSSCHLCRVFTGLGLLGIAEKVHSRGLIVAVEHPSYVHYWEEIGLKVAKICLVLHYPNNDLFHTGHGYTSKIQLRSSEPIEKALSKLAANDWDNFDFVFLDDLKRENYLDDYEHAVRLLRSNGLLVINQALNNGGVLTSVELMTENDRVISSMNARIKEDGRVRASLLPFGGGTWIIVKK
ncbi:O-methyltransferase [Necator americanus]|uniref:O-methyltransferase n=1 Tax=Necator americanus TaxID=51031 RepID=W2SHG9_NECAM|nr:O-methyltransferase [Necator americanus]ETN69003.1 O-methyltransferase [Necator americanus]